MIPWLLAAAAFAFDHAHTAYAEFLAGAVSDAGVDYGALAGRRAKLDAYVAELKATDVSTFTAQQKLATYVNAYNAFTIATMLDNGPPASIQNLDGGKVWDVRKFQIGPETLTLNQIENQRVRTLGDGRIHAAVNCASKGCPPLAPTPFVADKVYAQLDEGARRWARTNAYEIEGTTIHLSHIFEWYAPDFTKENKGDIPNVDGPSENALWFLSKFVDAATATKLQSGTLTATWQEYDWGLNKK